MSSVGSVSGVPGPVITGSVMIGFGPSVVTLSSVSRGSGGLVV